MAIQRNILNGELNENELNKITGGALIASEWVIVATILVLGAVTGLVDVQAAAPKPAVAKVPSSQSVRTL